MKKPDQKLTHTIDLMNDLQYHDGTSIGKKLNISRAAVWKIIHKLKEYNVPITATKGKGYKLMSPLILLNKEKIYSQLTALTQSCFLKNASCITILEKVNSTNDYLKAKASGHSHTQIVISESQQQGKGRLGRNWYSPFGENLYFSMSYAFNKDVSELSGLSLVVALAAVQALENIGLTKEKLKIKWPNDITVAQAKLAGILIEMQAESHGVCQVIIGIGINVNMTELNHGVIDKDWISLARITQQYHDRNTLCAHLTHNLQVYLQRFSQEGLPSFMEQWQAQDALKQKMITLTSGLESHTGYYLGINQQGHLLLETKNQKILSFSAGDSTLAQ